MDGIVKVADVDHPDGDANQRDDFGELLAKLIQLLLQRGLLLLSGGHLVTDLADLGGDAGGDANTNSLASSNVGALEVKKQ